MIPVARWTLLADEYGHLVYDSKFLENPRAVLGSLGSEVSCRTDGECLVRQTAHSLTTQELLIALMILTAFYRTRSLQGAAERSRAMARCTVEA